MRYRDEEVIGGTEMPHDLEWATERGEQKEAVANLKTQVTEIREELANARRDITDIKLMLATNKGGIRMLLTMGSIAASLGAIIATLVGEAIRWWHK